MEGVCWCDLLLGLPLAQQNYMLFGLGMFLGFASAVTIYFVIFRRGD